MATNRNAPKITADLSDKGKGELLALISAGGQYPVPNPAMRGEACQALIRSITEWVNRDETAETGPSHPAYVLGGMPADLLLAVIGDLNQWVRDPDRDAWATMLAVHAWTMARDELLAQFERMTAELAGETGF